MNSEEQFKNSLRDLVDSKKFLFDESNWAKAQGMRDEEQLKESLRDLVESKEFTFEKGDWKNAEALLHPEDKPERRVIWLAAAALLLLISGSLLYYFMQPATSTTDMASRTKTGSQAKNPATSGDSHLPETITNSAVPDHKTHAVELHPEPAAQPKQAAGSSVASPVKAANTTQAIDPSHVLPANETHGLPVKNAPVAAAPGLTPVHEDPITSPVAASSNAVKAAAGKNPARDNTTQTNPGNVTDPIRISTRAKQNALPAEPQPQVTSSAQEQAPLASLPAYNGHALTETSLETAYTAEPVAFLPFKPFESRDVSPDDIRASNITEIVLPALPTRMIMSFEAGTNYLLGWKNAGKREASGFNPVIGFHYYNYLTNKLAVSFGAQYTTVNNLSSYSNVSKISHYDLGLTSKVTVITPQKIHYISIPVKLNYFINTKNSIGGGINVAYLLTSDSKVQIYDESFNGQVSQKTYKSSGYTEGLAAFDTQLSVFYRRKIWKNLSVNAEVFYGLSDVKNNGFFNSGTSERNTGLKLTVMYNLFR